MAMMLGRPAAAALGAFPAASTRVRLVFADALELVVSRQLGFAACWFLVPPRVRVIGDLMHDIAREFDLLARCPDGLELVMEGFHLLANQGIELLRDNDTIVVQCPTIHQKARQSR
ncbi:hypothetical protein ATCC90586_011393 [Pythium insidiosum]|nr:hypothetical protein ATCC90586_011393 [Pythium insidiosum]